MNRTAGVVLSLAISALMLTQTRMARAADEPAKQPIVHVVLFDLKDKSTESVNAAIADCKSMLGGLPMVDQLKVGKPTGRAKDYDVGLYVHFRDVTDLRKYTLSTKHLELVGKYKDKVNKIRVFDFEAN